MPAHESPDVDKLCKVRLFLESLQADFTRCYNPHKEQATDEAIIKYKGRTSLKQYMPMKPIKCGIEVWCKADSHSKYLCDFDIYTGRHHDGIQRGLDNSVVTRLCQGKEGKWYNVYFDNFFTSCPMLEDPYSKELLACGTVRLLFPAVPFDKKCNQNNEKGRDGLEDDGSNPCSNMDRQQTSDHFWHKKLAFLKSNYLKCKEGKKMAPFRMLPVRQLFQPTTATWVELTKSIK